MTENNENKTISDVLRSVADVHKYLKAHAWKISKTQLYEHVDQKKIRRADDGAFYVSNIDKYALKYLRRNDGSKPSKDLADIQEQRYKADLRQSVAGAEMKELKISLLKGQYIPRDSFERALAERAILFKQDIETFCRSKAADIINLVGGNKEKIPDLIEHLLDETAKWLHAYSEDCQFAVPDTAQQLIVAEDLMNDDEET